MMKEESFLPFILSLYENEQKLSFAAALKQSRLQHEIIVIKFSPTSVTRPRGWRWDVTGCGWERCGKIKCSDDVRCSERVNEDPTARGEASGRKLWDKSHTGNLDTCVISAPATCDSSKALNTSLFDRRYLSTHHHFHNPLTWSKRHLPRWLLTPEAHLHMPDSRDSGG